MKKLVSLTTLGAAALLPSWAMAAAPAADKADNAFMMINTALVLFMNLPGIALFYGGLLRGKNVLSMLDAGGGQLRPGLRAVDDLWLLVNVRHR